MSTWVGIDGYYSKPSDNFTSVFAPTIDQVRMFTDKPILLSETAVGRKANQFANIVNLFNGMAQYRTLGLVWFDKDQSRADHAAGHTAPGLAYRGQLAGRAGVQTGRLRTDAGVDRSLAARRCLGRTRVVTNCN